MAIEFGEDDRLMTSLVVVAVAAVHYGSERALDDAFGISADSSHPRSPKSAGIVSVSSLQHYHEFCRLFLPLWHAFLHYKRHWQFMHANP